MPLHKLPKQLFVTGTDTDVGKSVAALLILKALQQAGGQPVYLKPLQTGCINPHAPGSDAAFIDAHWGKDTAMDPVRSTLYCFRQPKAPWLAALNSDQAIEPDELIKAINRFRETSPALVIEGAGGLMVPITRTFLMIDLMARLKIPSVLVARDGLGTINHTLLSIAALRSRNIALQGIVLMASGQNSTPPEMIAENKMAIEHFANVPVAGHVDWIEDFANVPASAEITIQNLLKTPATGS